VAYFAKKEKARADAALDHNNASTSLAEQTNKREQQIKSRTIVRINVITIACCDKMTA
jgi:hypothetical protein